MKKIKRFIFSILVGAGVAYTAICVYFYSIQNDIIFKPYKLAENAPLDYPFDFSERWFTMPDGIRIHTIHAKADSSQGKLVFFMHGNLGNVNTDPLKYSVFLDEGYDVLYPDYRTFGKSEGELTKEADLIEDMDRLYQQMSSEYAEDSIVVVGYSLGAAIAAQVASRNNPRNVMLWAPFYSMIDEKDASYGFLPDFLLRYPLRTDRALPNIDEPVTIIYAEDDEVLPVKRSLKLVDLLKTGDEHLILERQKHGEMYRNSTLKKELPRILSKQ
ncbi:MAG: alpha/beta fold hydrolase [Bacteroidota bacterium]